LKKTQGTKTERSENTPQGILKLARKHGGQKRGGEKGENKPHRSSKEKSPSNVGKEGI